MTDGPAGAPATGGTGDRTGSTPRFSIVTAVYNVAPYLEDFIRSIESQGIGPGDLEVIAVDDGSTDGSLERLRQWSGESRFKVGVYSQPNAGQGPARNLGLDHVTGEWINFTDPDDILAPDFLPVAARFADDHPAIRIMAGKPFVFDEKVGRVTDTHHRRKQYRGGNRVVDLGAEPNVFPGSTTVGFYRGDQIRELGLRYDPRIRPNFEDGHFAAHYLLSLEAPRVGLLRDAHYIYRRRAAGTSTLQRSLAHPGRFTDVLRHGYLEVLDAARARLGSVPAWLQHVVIYELSWYLSADEKITSDIDLPAELLPRYHELFGEIVRRLDPDVVAGHRARPLRLVWADILAHGYRSGDWHMPFVVRGKLDRDMGLRRMAYRFTGSRPTERFEVDGVEVPVAFGKVRAHRYYGRTVMEERIAWIPEGKVVAMTLNGLPVPVRERWIERGSRNARRFSAERSSRAGGRSIVRSGLRRVRRIARRVVRRNVRRVADLRFRALRLASKTSFLAGGYRDAWVLMDRVNNADDNAERLFEHLKSSRPDINAWFTVAATSIDYRRLRAAGERRLVAWGSWRWKLLMLNARWLVSSHADRGLVEPPELIRAAGGRPWKFAFPQHGITKDDLSLWLNNREIDLFVTSTAAELESVAGDGTGYKVTSKETRNTGLPRFDRLLAKAQAVPAAERDLVIVAPTWRTRLTGAIDARTQQRGVAEAYWTSEYHASWMGILRSEAIADAVERRGWRLGFMPHPNLQPILDRLELPPHVERLSFEGTDVQGLYARCGLLVTDYSSVFFNLAYIDRPVVYFQFDRAEMLRGGHMGRKGYFDYERDGFGPVVEDLDAAVQAITASIDAGAAPSPRYQARIDATFPARDGRCCERVVAAIEELSRPYAGPVSEVELRSART